MTKKDICIAVAEQAGISVLQTEKVVQMTFDAIVSTLITERRLELRGFGVFEVRQRAARRARNPRTGEKVFVPERLVVRFKPSKELEARLGPKSDSPAGTNDAA